jgi:FkbM family methyltransferase
MFKLAIRELEAQLSGRIALRQLKDRRFLNPLARRAVLKAACRWAAAMPPGFRPRSVLDVGANVGAIARELSCLYRPEVLGLVEANPDLAAKLVELDIGCPKRVFACAMGERPGTIPFTLVRKGDSENFASSSVLALSGAAKNLWNLKAEQTIQVPMRTLDDVWQECGAGRSLDLLKLDVQGYEPQVLMGGAKTLEKTKVIVAEISFFREYEGQWLFRQLYDYLLELGFEFSAMYEMARKKSWHPLQCNGVFVNVKV